MNTTDTTLKGWDPFDKYRCRDPKARDIDLFFEQVNRPHKPRNPKYIRQAELQRRRQNAIEVEAIRADLDEINTRTLDVLRGIFIGGFASFAAVCVGLILALV